MNHFPLSNKSIVRCLIGVAALSLIACASKKKVEETPAAAAAAAPESNVMSFDPSGSDSGKIDGLNTIFFEYDRAELTSDAKKTLSNNAGWIKNNSNFTIQIEGHCDERGSVEYNLALGERRAKAVKAYLTGLGIDAKRMTIISYGEEKPIAQGDSESAYSRNRRANFVPLPQ